MYFLCKKYYRKYYDKTPNQRNHEKEIYELLRKLPKHKNIIDIYGITYKYYL